MLELRLLGSFSIKSDKRNIKLPSRAGQSLLAFLVLNAGTHFRRERLAGQFWPESTEEAARDYLRHALWRVRKALQAASCEHLLQTDDLTVAFLPSKDYWLDAAVLLAAGQSRSADGLMKALSVYRGELLPGFYEDWVVLEREHLRAIYEQEMDRLLGMLEQDGRWGEILEWAEKWIACGQKPEPAYRGLMLAHAANGDMSKVVSSYERCVQTLAEFGVEPSEKTRGLFEEIKSGRHSAAVIRATAARKLEIAPSSNIPVPLTSFVGRERELKKISELLASSRLVTLTGPGGVGKTRLAIRAATDAMKQYADGACWVDLVELMDPNLLPQEVAQALRVRENASAPLVETLTAYLHSRQLLLILDNCEHLIEACARLAEQLLAACPHLRILATSIEALGLFNETVWQVPSLPFAADAASMPWTKLRQVESIQLFGQRGARASETFVLDEANAADVAQICQRLEGIPLAIELAAARTKVLSVHEIAARLDDRFSLLTAGSRTAIPRHQTLRATIDWSHELLTEPERTLFRRVSVFAGGFTLAAMEAVCNCEMQTDDMLDLLGRLVGKSLLAVAAPQGGATRYRMLETIRQYALEKLVAAGEVAETRTRHLDFYLRLAEESELKIYGLQSGDWFRRLYRELDNLRSATDWAITAGKAQLAERLLGAIVYFWMAHGLPSSEWNERVREALNRTEGLERTLARAKALNGIGFMYWVDAYPVDEHSELEEALAIGRELGDATTTATALRHLGLLEAIEGHYEEARRDHERSLVIWSSMGADGLLGRAHTMAYFGDVALLEGNAQEAKSIFQEAVGELEAAGDLNLRAYAVRRLAQLALRSGDLEQARLLCRQSMGLNLEVTDSRGVCACLAGFMAIATVVGDVKRALVLAAAVEHHLAILGVGLLYMDRLEFEANLAHLNVVQHVKDRAKLQSRGATMSLEEAVDLALEVGS